MKKIFSIITIIMVFFSIACPSFAYDDDTYGDEYILSDFESSNRTDLYSFDVCLNMCGDSYDESEIAPNAGFSFGLGADHIYLGGLVNWSDYKYNDSNVCWGAHIGYNYVFENSFGHCGTITPCVGVYSPMTDYFSVDYGVVWKINHNNSNASFVVKTFAKSGASIGVAFNFGN